MEFGVHIYLLFISMNSQTS